MELVEDKQKIAEKEGIIYVGDKPLKSYLYPALIHLSNKREVTLLARGKHIAKAIVLSKRLRDTTKAEEEIKIGTITSSRKTEDKEVQIDVAEIQIKLKALGEK